jgi:hypothetical protein
MQSTEAQSKERMTLFVTPELSTKIRVIAAQERKTLSDVAIEAFQHFIESTI